MKYTKGTAITFRLCDEDIDAILNKRVVSVRIDGVDYRIRKAFTGQE